MKKYINQDSSNKKRLYRYIAHLIRKNDRFNRFFILAGKFIFRIFGFATISYGPAKILVTPYQNLDIFLLMGENINPFLTSAIAQLLKNGGIMLDIGANHGVLSVLAAMNPKVEVFSFEPSPRELMRFYQNILLNDLNNISVFPYGLGETATYQEFILTNDDNPGMNSLPSVRKTGQSIFCKFIPLPELVSDELIKKVKLIKLDIEGQEMGVLRSLKNKMSLLNHAYFIIEIANSLLEANGSSSTEIYNFFAEHGFIFQYGANASEDAWEECFFNPQYSTPIIFSASIS